MKNLTQIALQYHISKAALTQRINKIPNFRQKYCKRKKNRLFISNDGIKLISQPKHNSTSKAFHTRRGKNQSQLTRSDLLSKNKQLISVVASQQYTIADQRKSLSLANSMLPDMFSSLKSQHRKLAQGPRPQIQESYNPKADKAIQAALIDKNKLSKMKIKHLKDIEIIKHYQNMSWIDKLKNLF